ncbi:protein FAM199X-like [Lineus longissimus]|uniref:protein FAM199X-like n=1 Tax=Lineus longissimus TaxID=88925 RepID=UPI002B4E4E93
MIADTAVFSSSPWGSDMLFNKDLFMFNQANESKVDAYSLDMDIATLEAELERVKNYSNNSVETRLMNDTLNSASCSVAGSDYSDEACLDVDQHVSDELFPVSEEQEFLSSSLSHLLEGTIAENGNMLLSWTEDDEDDSPSQSTNTTTSSEETINVDVDAIIIPSMPCSPCSPRSPSPSPMLSRPLKRKQCCILDDTKLWCEMCDEEQITTVEELSEMISGELGLREQLDVIRIIYPEANISPADTEFVIDLDYLDDDKLQQVRDYIRQQTKSTNRHSLTSCDSCNETNSPVQKKHTKKQSRERRSQQKELRQRQRKEYRQMMKERRSGLFKKEEVLSLTTPATSREDLDPDGDDIDILD